MSLFKNSLDLIGNTPLLLAEEFARKNNLNANIYLKIESMNPAGSIKDRTAYYLLKKALERGQVKPGGVIVEPTSGNTGIGLAYVASTMGIRTILTMPESMSEERRKLLRSYNAELVLTPKEEGMNGAVKKAQQIAKEIDGAFIPSQFDNPDNPLAHYETTAPEIWRDSEGKIDVFLAGIGTGGTVSGCAKYFKEKNKNIYIVGIEPEDSPLITKGQAGAHKLQGIGANFIPGNLDMSLIDEVITISTDEAYSASRAIMQSHGLYVGITSGAALAGVIKLASRPSFAGKNICAVLPDSGDRYLSTEGYLD